MWTVRSLSGETVHFPRGAPKLVLGLGGTAITFSAGTLSNNSGYFESRRRCTAIRNAKVATGCYVEFGLMSLTRDAATRVLLSSPSRLEKADTQERASRRWGTMNSGIHQFS